MTSRCKATSKATRPCHRGRTAPKPLSTPTSALAFPVRSRCRVARHPFPLVGCADVNRSEPDATPRRASTDPSPPAAPKINLCTTLVMLAVARVAQKQRTHPTGHRHLRNSLAWKRKVALRRSGKTKTEVSSVTARKTECAGSVTGVSCGCSRTFSGRSSPKSPKVPSEPPIRSHFATQRYQMCYPKRKRRPRKAVLCI